MTKFALVGCGKMAHWHASELAKLPDVKVIALVDPVPARTAEIRTKYFPEALEFSEIDALFADPRIKLDAVNLVTPHTLHYAQAKSALERGLHVLVEKPMVTKSADAYDLWGAVKVSGKLLAITYQAPYTDEFAYLAQLRDSGRWGKVQLVSGSVSQNWLKATAGTWRQDPALSGGGQMFDTGAHLLNAAMWLINDPVVEVGCFYDRCSSPVDINGVAIAKFQNGVMASFCIGGNCPMFRNELQIQTDTMLILTDQYGKKLEIFGPEGQRIYPQSARPSATQSSATQSSAPQPSAASPHRNFVNAILGREPLRAGVRYGVLLTALKNALLESNDNQRMVRVEPVPADI